MNPLVMQPLAACAAAILLLPAAASAQTFKSSAGPLSVETVVGGLVNPWALAFLPDGRMLVTEKPGRIRIATPDGKLTAPLAGVPKVAASGQGGMLDIAVDRDFAKNQTIYFCYAESGDGGSRTALARARLDPDKLEDVKPIFRQEPAVSTGRHFGCRIVQGRDGHLFLTMGDRGDHSDEAQNLRSHIGKIVRIATDGSVPKDNPFVGRKDAKPEIFSYGNRNVQGAALHPVTGKLWANEHGPRGGDELNIIEAGKNYGWPVIGYGVDYSGAKIHEGTAKPGMEQPVRHWTPSFAPSGMAFMTGKLFPKWEGSAFIGALRGQMVLRVALDGEKATGDERILEGLRERIRDVRTGPDGALYLLTDNSAGRILKVTPGK
jgi:aldose sugar dehydrogenase